MKLGIGSYAFAWSIGFPDAIPEAPVDAFGMLHLADELGVRVVQYGSNLPLDALPEDELRHLIRCARDREIEIEIGTRGIDPASLARQVKLAKKVGSSILRWSVDISDGVIVGISEVAKCVNCLLPELQRNEVRLAIENSHIPAVKLAEMLQAADSPWLGSTLDTVNSLAIPEGHESVIENLAPYVVSLHIKDFQVSRMWHRMGFVVEGRPVGEGQLDVPRLLATLRGVRVRANAILELWPPEQSTLAETIALEHRWATQSISYLRRYISN
jgi:3-oxoisoapionate decarboxylase